MLQQTRELYVITEDSPEAAGDAQVDLLALGTWFQPFSLENGAFSFAWGLAAKKQARGLGVLKAVSWPGIDKQGCVPASFIP